MDSRFPAMTSMLSIVVAVLSVAALQAAASPTPIAAPAPLPTPAPLPAPQALSSAESIFSSVPGAVASALPTVLGNWPSLGDIEKKV
ncbi:hypothetical protein C8Q79DRAFT_637621 [Trametes meyenii]|nr:hypothetical protein C8Q79DRAFT_637621 [Trametes meyenii]